MHLNLYVHACACTSVSLASMFGSVYTCQYVSENICVHVYICVCVHACVSIQASDGMQSFRNKKRTRRALFLKVPEHPRGSEWGRSNRDGSLEHKQSSANRVMALAVL